MEAWYHLGAEGGGTVNSKEISEKQCYEKALLSDPNNAGGIALLSLVSLVCSFLCVCVCVFSLVLCVSYVAVSCLLVSVCLRLCFLLCLLYLLCVLCLVSCLFLSLCPCLYLLSSFVSVCISMLFVCFPSYA